MKSLKDIFDKMPESSVKLFEGIDETGYSWRTNMLGVLCYPSEDGNERPLKALKGILPPGLKLDAMYPENFFRATVPVSSNDIELMYRKPLFITGKEIMILDKAVFDSCTKTKSDTRVVIPVENTVVVDKELEPAGGVLCFLPEALCGYSEKEVKYSIGVTYKDRLCLIVRTEKEFLYRILNNHLQPLYCTISGDVDYNIDSWDDKTQIYRKVTKMALNLNLPDLNKPPRKEVEKAVADSAEDMADTLMKSLDIQSKEASESSSKSKAPAKKEVKTVEPVAEVPVEAPVEKKPKRINKPKKNIRDLKDIIEEISSTVPEDMPVEAVLNEIRQLRDLIKVASCRSANLSTMYLDKATVAAKKLEAVTCLLSQKN